MPRPMESVAPARPVAFGQFIDEERKAALVMSPLAVLSVRFDRDHTYQGKLQPRWLLDVVELSSGDVLCPTFGSNSARDSILAALGKLIDENPDNEPAGSVVEPIVMFMQQGKPGSNPWWSFRTATDEELAGANLELTGGRSIAEAVRERVAEALAEAAEAIETRSSAADDEELPF